MTDRTLPSFWLLEDTSGHLKRESRADAEHVDLRLYRVAQGAPELMDTRSYTPGTLTREANRSALAVELIRSANAHNEVVVCSHRLASAKSLVQAFTAVDFKFVVEIGTRTHVRFRQRGRPPGNPTPQWKLRSAEWTSIDPRAPKSNAHAYATDLGKVDFAGIEKLRCFALRIGAIATYDRGTLVALSNLDDEVPLPELTHLLGWVRWIRPLVRKAERAPSIPVTVAVMDAPTVDPQLALNLPVRANLQIAKRLDESAAANRSPELFQARPRGLLAAEQRPLNVVELFAGAGGMGLGFLLANGTGPTRFRIVYSGEVHPVYAHTLRTNHQHLRQSGIVEADSLPETVNAQDLRETTVETAVAYAAREQGRVDVLIGGPPCQGFSSANRNSWSSANPNNQLVDRFLDYVALLEPKILLMENVQGILWTAKHGPEPIGLSVAYHVIRRLSALGYKLYPKLLDAAWYGVPQHRNRFFLLGIHSDFGYHREDFGEWGPFPLPTHGPGAEKPYVTVEQAISDLPAVQNGHSEPVVPYEEGTAVEGAFVQQMRAGAAAGQITDHVVSRQADYVIERYRLIPEGENWEAIRDLMTNYADVGRTHSNIYRRLKWNEPSITIGHYRKSMIIHPAQDRGLSLREAARLQSFPDWFRFAGAPNSLDGGITHKQQQLANAVCPLVTRAVAKYILAL